MTLILGLMLFLQTPGPPVSEVALYNQLVDAGPTERLRLGLSYEQKFPRSRYIGDVSSLIMDVYVVQNNIPKMLEYGEKTIRAKPDDLHALVVVARQLAINGSNVEKAAQYARHAIVVADRLKTTKPPENHTAQTWTAFVATNRTSAESTLKYIQQMTLNLLRRR